MGAAVLAGAELSTLLTMALGVCLAAAGATGLGAWWGRLTLRRFERLASDLRRASSAADDIERVSELRPRDEAIVARAANEVFARARAQLAQAESDHRLLTSLVEHSPSGVLIVDERRRILMVNGKFCEIFDLRANPEGRLAAEVITAPEVLDMIERGAQAASDGDRLAIASSRDVVLRLVPTGSGELAIVAQDVTRFRSAERARTAFVANVSHELRTPMAAILGYAETLSTDPALSDEVLPLVEALTRNSRRLRDTFEGLMNLARVEARSGQLSLEPLRLAPLLAEAMAAPADLAAQKGVAFEVDCPPELTASVNAEAFDVIVGNLAFNAVKYTPEGGEVRVVAAAVEGQVELHFIDTGIGIEAAHQERIFERFFRVDEGRDRSSGGAGLGLAMVKHLSLATGAHIRLSSAPSQGSTFVVTFPQAGRAA
ncbi:MAG: PAS domain-containing protein [Deltaproteobacteria bacterium]|nr:MAG: PAS domain-containing protein [Deltaproteobacteria bacterium]